MHSKDKLAEALFAAGLPTLAHKAAAGLYHDYLSPSATPELDLDADLVAAITGGNQAATALRARHHNGEFDATAEESEEWARSPEGQAAFRELTGGPGGYSNEETDFMDTTKNETESGGTQKPGDKLIEALRAAGLNDLAEKAASGAYGDGARSVDLENDLRNAINAGNPKATEIRDQIQRGEFEGGGVSKPQGDEGVQSKALGGQEQGQVERSTEGKPASRK